MHSILILNSIVLSLTICSLLEVIQHMLEVQ
jgi:hypothetical protein